MLALSLQELQGHHLNQIHDDLGLRKGTVGQDVQGLHGEGLALQRKGLDPVVGDQDHQDVGIVVEKDLNLHGEVYIDLVLDPQKEDVKY